MKMRYNEPAIPVGTKIELISMPDDPDPIPSGTRGVVVGGSAEQLWVEWEIRRSLNLLVGVDDFRIVS
jgi:hypothetical protein